MGRHRKIAPGVGERILHIANLFGSIAEMADHLEMPLNTLNNYIRGDRDPSFQFISKLASIDHVDMNWLLTGRGSDGQMEQPIGPFVSPPYPGKYVSIPHYRLHRTNGLELVESCDWPTIPHPILSALPSQTDQRRLGTVVAEGDSMRPTINEGDVLLFDFNAAHSTTDAEGVHLISLNDNYMIKRVQKMADGDLNLISDNSKFESERVKSDIVENRLKNHGKVVWVGAAFEHLR